MTWPNQSAAANRRPAGQLDGSGILLAIVAADRAFPAAVAELGSLGVLRIMKTKYIIKSRAAIAVAATLLLAIHANAVGFLLNGDTPMTGSSIGSIPLITPFGTVTFVGEMSFANSDPEFLAAGASGNVFDINNTSTATLTFSFDVASITFIYGGNAGVMDVRARNINGETIASFYQADTSAGQPAGPVTLSGVGIRSLFWTDPGLGFAPLDNLQVTVVPEPSTSLLGLVAGLLTFLRRPRNGQEPNHACCSEPGGASRLAIVASLPPGR